MRRAVLVALVAVCVLGAGGCVDPGQPSTTLLTPPATTAVETPATPTLEPMGPPEFPMPAEARVETDAGAEAATLYYFQLQDHLLQTLDPEWLRRLSRDCDSCDENIATFDADRAAGNRVEGGRSDITAFFTDYDWTGRASVGLLVEQESFRVVAPDGAVVPNGDVAARRLTGGASLSWSQVELVWFMNGYTLVQSS